MCALPISIVTATGRTFAGRVGASLLAALDMPELVAADMQGYETLALALARTPEKLAAVKAKLARNRETSPLFDTARFTRNLETAYFSMWERHRRGDQPASFAVEDAVSAS